MQLQILKVEDCLFVNNLNFKFRGRTIIPASKHVRETKGEDEKHLNDYNLASVIVSSCETILETFSTFYLLFTYAQHLYKIVFLAS